MTPSAQNLPDWMILFAFVASLLLTLLKVLETLLGAFRKANLEIVLTRELFFRLLESGESLYVNAVLVAYDTGALIKDIKAVLRKENGSIKEFTLNVAQIGEKYRTPDGLYQFSFHSTSPLTFVPENNPLRLVYVCEHDSYAQATRQEFYRLRLQLYGIRDRYPDLNTLDESQGRELLSQISQVVTDTCTSIMDKIQVEPGSYTLTISVAYRQKGKFVPLFKMKHAQATIKFVVDNQARDLLRHALNQYLMQKSVALLANVEATQLPSLDYYPTTVTES